MLNVNVNYWSGYVCDFSILVWLQSAKIIETSVLFLFSTCKRRQNQSFYQTKAMWFMLLSYLEELDLKENVGFIWVYIVYKYLHLGSQLHLLRSVIPSSISPRWNRAIIALVLRLSQQVQIRATAVWWRQMYEWQSDFWKSISPKRWFSCVNSCHLRDKAALSPLKTAPQHFCVYPLKGAVCALLYTCCQPITHPSLCTDSSRLLCLRTLFSLFKTGHNFSWITKKKIFVAL